VERFRGRRVGEKVLLQSVTPPVPCCRERCLAALHDEPASGFFERDLQDPIAKVSLETLLLYPTAQEDLLGVPPLFPRSTQVKNVAFQLNGKPFLTYSRQLCDQADVALLVEQIDDRLSDFLYDRALGRLLDVAEGFEDRLASVQRPDRNAKNAIEVFATGTLRCEALLTPDLTALFSEFAGQLNQIAQALKEPAEG